MTSASGTGTRLLWTLGSRMARTRGGSAHRAALTLAAVLALVTVWGVVAAHTVHDRRDARMTTRNPVPEVSPS